MPYYAPPPKQTRAQMLAENLRVRAPAADVPTAVVADSPPPPPVPPPPPQPPTWPFRMPPATYVGLHPDGKHADLARKVLNGAAGRNE